MADLPPGRLPESAFTPFRAAGLAHGPEDVPKPDRSEARGVVSKSEVASGDELQGSDNSLSEDVGSDGDLGDDSGEDAGSVNTDEEYRRDLEEQRIADEKNGHFSEAHLPAGDVGSDGDLGDDLSGDATSVNTEEEYRRDLEDQRITEEKNGHFSETQLPAGGRLTSSEATAAHVARVFYEIAESSCMNRDVFVGERGSSSMIGDPPPWIPDDAGDPATAISLNHHVNLQSDGVGMEKEEMMGVGTHCGG